MANYSGRRPPERGRPAAGSRARSSPTRGTAGRPAPSRSAPSRTSSGSRRPPGRGKARWRVDNPLRLTLWILVFAALIVFGVTRLLHTDKPAEPAEASSESSTIVPESSQEPEPEESSQEEAPKPSKNKSGYHTSVSDLDTQLMGFMSGFLLGHAGDHAQDPEPTTGDDRASNRIRYDYHVLIDPAHGGEDTGFIVGDVVESDVNLAVARLVQQKIREKDVSIEATLTHDENTYMSLEDRIQMANDRQVDFFLNLQCSGSESDLKATGTSGVYWDSEGGTPRGIKSYAAAYQITNVASLALGISNLGINKELLEVLYKTSMPACSIRLCYLSNEIDRSLLLESTYMDLMAEAIAQKVVDIVLTYEPHVDVNIPGATHVNENSSEIEIILPPESSEESSAEEWTDDGYTEEWTDDGYTEDWTDDGYTEDWTDDGYTEDWTDDGYTEDWTDDGGTEDWTDDGGTEDWTDDGGTEDWTEDWTDDGGTEDWTG